MRDAPAREDGKVAFVVDANEFRPHLGEVEVELLGWAKTVDDVCDAMHDLYPEIYEIDAIRRATPEDIERLGG